MVDFTSLAGRLVARDEENCGASRCEKPVPVARILLIVSLTLGGALILGTLTVLLVLHKRRQRRDKREDAIANLDLGDDIIEDYPTIQRPRPSRHTEQQRHNYGPEAPNPYGDSSRWENRSHHGRSPVRPSQGRSPLLPSHADGWSDAGNGKPGGDR